jgi:membrane-associated phospholipid phosphatase
MGSRLSKLRSLLHWLVVGSPLPAGTGCSSAAVDGRREAADEGGPAGSRRLLAVSFLAVAAFSVLSFVSLDRPIAYACSGLKRGIREFFRVVTTFGLSGWYLVPSLLLFLLFRFRSRKAAQAGRALFVFLTISLSGIVVDIVKFILGRYRPAMLFHENLYGFAFFRTEAIATSFPSGHAAVITALAISLDAIWPKFRVLYAFAALFVIGSRVATCAHFLSDVAAGAYVAVITTFALKRFFEESGIDLRRGGGSVGLGTGLQERPR